MATRDRWLIVEENDDLWLIKREGSEVRGRIVSREGLRREFPRLYDQLVASDHKDAWPAAGFVDTEKRCLLKLEVAHGKASVCARI